jgi:hypothetical protein
VGWVPTLWRLVLGEGNNPRRSRPDSYARPHFQWLGSQHHHIGTVRVNRNTLPQTITQENDVANHALHFDSFFCFAHQSFDEGKSLADAVFVRGSGITGKSIATIPFWCS